MPDIPKYAGRVRVPAFEQVMKNAFPSPAQRSKANALLALRKYELITEKESGQLADLSRKFQLLEKMPSTQQNEQIHKIVAGLSVSTHVGRTIKEAILEAIKRDPVLVPTRSQNFQMESPPITQGPPGTGESDESTPVQGSGSSQGGSSNSGSTPSSRADSYSDAAVEGAGFGGLIGAEVGVKAGFAGAATGAVIGAAAGAIIAVGIKGAGDFIEWVFEDEDGDDDDE